MAAGRRGRLGVAGDPGGDERRLLPPRLFMLFLIGCVVFAYPALWPMSPGVRLVGIPVLFVYLFVAWAAFIAALGLLIESATRSDSPPAPPGEEP